MDPFDWSCVAHVHSTYSDGTATVLELIEDAAASGRDAILLTDHDTVAAGADGWGGWRGGVLVVVGTEITTGGGHLLAFGVDRSPEMHDRPGREASEWVVRNGGACFAAHPFSEGSEMSRTVGRPHPWEDLDEDPSLTGIEVWSLITDAAESWRNPLQGLRFIRRPRRFTEAPRRERLLRWDRLGAERRLVGIGGLDAHQSGFRAGRQRPVSPFPNDRFFGSLATHVLTDEPPSGDASADRRSLLAALTSGRCYLSLDWERSARGFRFQARSSSAAAPMGAEVAVDGGPWELHCRVPHPARLLLLRNGRVIQVATGAESLAATVEAAGVYRVEARLEVEGRREVPWVFSNPIYLRERGDERNQRADDQADVGD